MKKYRILYLAGAVSLLATIPAAAATRTYSTEVVNTITTGDISISLEEFELDPEGRRIPYVDGKVVIPGQHVDKIVTITNEAQEAWLRAKAEYNTDDGLEGMSDRMLGGMSEKWKKCGGYFYYTEPVAGGESVDFFRQVVIPGEWDETCEEKGFSIGVTAQAVQRANLTPDFSSEETWFGIQVEKCIHDSHAIYQVESPAEFSILFANGSEGFIRTGEDFFENFSSMLPGDTLTDTLVVGNHFGETLDFYFYTDVPEQEEDSRMLLDQLQLTIQSGNTRIYEGSLGAEALREGIRLGDPFRKGDVRELTYTLHMPAELTNGSALQTARVRWIFETQTHTGSGGGPSGGGTPSRSRAVIPEAVQELVTLPGYISVPLSGSPGLAERMGEWLLPRTGDRSGRGMALPVFLIGGAAWIFLLGKRRRKGNHSGRMETVTRRSNGSRAV